MADRHYIGWLIEDLLRRLHYSGNFSYDPQGRLGDGGRLLLAEVAAAVRLAQPPDGVQALLDECVAELSALSPAVTRKTEECKHTIINILETAKRWSERLGDAAAAADRPRPSPDWPDRLETDIDRVLFKRLGSMWIVRVLVAVLFVAAALGLFGVLHFGSLQFDLMQAVDAKERQATALIEDKRSKLAAEVEAAQKSLDALTRSLAAQSTELAQNQQALGDLTATAHRLIDKLASGESQQIVQASEDARKKIEAERRDGVALLQGKINQELDTALDEGRHALADATRQRVAALMSQAVPEFQEQLGRNQQQLNALERRLNEADGKRALIDAALRTLGAPDAGLTGKLAAAFGTSVKMVHGVLAGLLSLLLANIAVLVFAWRSR